MSLQLNESRTYREFSGQYVNTMPRLLAEGFTPLTVADIMRRRLDVASSNDPVLRSAWLDNYFDTSDAVLYHPNGNIKIVRDAEPLLTINTHCDVRAGALVITNDVYGFLAGPEFACQDLNTDMPLSKARARANPIWQALAGDDQSLLKAYTDLVFQEAERRFGFTKNMDVYLGSAEATPSVRAWIVLNISGRSVLGGSIDLDNGIGRLVGVAPAAQSRDK